ncbi:MAG: reverse transcriptase domain-containing protein, partial [Candidatus Fonsibacter sp.]
MGRNVQRTIRDLSDERAQRTNTCMTPLWRDVLGQRAEAAWEACDLSESELSHGCPAVVFADQSKAFERVSLHWLDAVLRGWNLPHWARLLLYDTAADRTVRHDDLGNRGFVRQLRCGIGMGGTAGLLLLNMAYDPIVHGLRAAVGVVAPIFVDDLAALVWGPRQAARVQAFLLAAGHCAGLLMESHDCGAVVIAPAMWEGQPVR